MDLKILQDKIYKSICEALSAELIKKQTVTKPLQLYHLSTLFRDGELMFPRIPRNPIDEFEDTTTPRVCFSSTIAGAYRAVQQWGGYCDMYVYEPLNIDKIVEDGNLIKCTKEMVCDVDITNEYWITCPVRLRLINKIRIGYNEDLFDVDDKGEYSYKKAKVHFKTYKDIYESRKPDLEGRPMTKEEKKKQKEEHWKFKDYEDYPNELERMTRQVGKKNKKGEFDIYYTFGKNGLGLTKELVAIGDDIYQLSKKYHVYLGNEPHFDSIDDAYDFTITCIPKKVDEGSWGYEPKQSDTYWDLSHHIVEPILKQLMDGFSKGSDHTKYAYMGFINGFIQNTDIWFESLLDEDGYALYDMFKEAYDKMSDENSDFIQSWEDKNKIKKQLDKVWEDFNKYIKEYIGTPIPKEIRKKYHNSIEWLGTGEHIAKWYGCNFKVKDTGKVYYIDHGPRCSEQQAKWEKYYTEKGKIKRLS